MVANCDFECANTVYKMCLNTLRKMIFQSTICHDDSGYFSWDLYCGQCMKEKTSFLLYMQREGEVRVRLWTCRYVCVSANGYVDAYPHACFNSES